MQCSNGKFFRERQKIYSARYAIFCVMNSLHSQKVEGIDDLGSRILEIHLSLSLVFVIVLKWVLSPPTFEKA